MKESSLVPCNLLSWPIHQNLLPDEKLIISSLWFAGFINCAGFGFISIKGFAADIGLDPAALIRGLKNLHSINSIIYDEVTGEVFLIRWFSFHKFVTGPQIANFKSAMKKIDSEVIKNEILKKQPKFPETHTNQSLNKQQQQQQQQQPEEDKPSSLHADALPEKQSENLHKPSGEDETSSMPLAVSPEKKEYTLIEGMICWYATDRINANKLIQDFGVELVKKAIKELAGIGRQPFPSYVGLHLENYQRNQNAEPEINYNPSGGNKGLVTASDADYYGWNT